MSIREKNKVLMGVLSLLFFTACGADKNQEDYRKSLAQAYSARVAPVVGTYSGQIKSSIDGASMGNLSISIVGDQVLQTSADGVTTEQQTIIRGTVKYNGLVASNVDYNLAFYNPDNHAFQINVKKTDSSGVNHLINIEGSLVNDQFDGIFLVDTYATYGGTVHLVKNAAVTNALPELRSARAREMMASNGSFVASMPDAQTGITRTVSLTLKSLVTNPFFKLTDVFSPVHSVSAQFDVYAPDLSQGAKPGALRLESSQIFVSELDDQNNLNYLNGTKADAGNPNLVLTVSCSRKVSSAGVILGLDCSGGSKAGAFTYPALFVPASSTGTVGN